MYGDVHSVNRWARELHAHLRGGGENSGYIARRCDVLLSDMFELFRLRPGPPTAEVVASEARQLVACSEAAELLQSVDAPALEALEKSWREGAQAQASPIDDWPQLILSAASGLGEISDASLKAIRRLNEAATVKHQEVRVAREHEMRGPAAMIGSVRQSAMLLVGEGCLEPVEADQIEDLMDSARLRLERYFGYPEVLAERPVHAALGRSLMRVFEFAGFRPRNSPFTQQRAACYSVAIAARKGFTVSPTTLSSNRLPSMP